jgi:hypothetical protein
MTRIESTSAAQAATTTQPQEFDFVVLGGGTGFDRRSVDAPPPNRSSRAWTDRE